MSPGNVEIIQRSFVTWGETGEPAWDLLHDDVEAHDHDIMDAGEYRGLAGVHRWFEDWGSAWSEYSVEPEEFIDAGEHVVVILRMTAKGRGSGIEIERQDAFVFEMRDGKIARMDYFNNRADGLKAVGLEE
ncbi:MAG TPA: nuclear transport factor 2 family protein [Solirubrobacteraceae bacterium]|jgi:ketosteroid isomerase-like protein